MEIHQFFIFFLLNVLQTFNIQNKLPYDQEIFIPIPLILHSSQDTSVCENRCMNCKKNVYQSIVIYPCGCLVCTKCVHINSQQCVNCCQPIQSFMCANNLNLIKRCMFQCPYKKCQYIGTYQQCIQHCMQCQCIYEELQDNARARFYMYNIYKDINQHLHNFIKLLLQHTQRLQFQKDLEGQVTVQHIKLDQSSYNVQEQGDENGKLKQKVSKLKDDLHQKEEMIKQLFLEQNDNINQIESLKKNIEKLKNAIKVYKNSIVQKDLQAQSGNSNTEQCMGQRYALWQQNQHKIANNTNQTNDKTDAQCQLPELTVANADGAQSKHATRPTTTYSLHSQNISTEQASILSQYKASISQPQQQGKNKGNQTPDENADVLQMMKQLHRENERLKVQVIQTTREAQQLKQLLAGRIKQELMSHQQKDLSTIIDDEIDQTKTMNSQLQSNMNQLSIASDESFISEVQDAQDVCKTVSERLLQQSVPQPSGNAEQPESSADIINAQTKQKNRSCSVLAGQSFSYVSSLYQLDIQASTPIQVRLLKEIEQLKKANAQQQELITQKQIIISYKDMQIQELEEQSSQQKQSKNESTNIQQQENTKTQKDKQIQLLNEIIKIKEEQWQEQINLNNIFINRQNKQIQLLQEKIREFEAQLQLNIEKPHFNKHQIHSSSTIIFNENDPIIKEQSIEKQQIQGIENQKNKQQDNTESQKIIQGQENNVQVSKVNYTLVNQATQVNASLQNCPESGIQVPNTMIQSSLKPQEYDNHGVNKDEIIHSLEQQCSFLQDQINKHISQSPSAYKKQQLLSEQDKLIDQYKKCSEMHQKKYDILNLEIKNFCQHLISKVFNVNQRYNKLGTDFQGLKNIVNGIINKYNNQIDQQNRQLTQQQKLNEQQIDYWKKYYDKYNQLLQKQRSALINNRNQSPKYRQLYQSPTQHEKILKQNKDRIANLQNEVQRLQTQVIVLKEQLSHKKPSQDASKIPICNIRLTDSNKHYTFHDSQQQIKQSIPIQETLQPNDEYVTIDDLNFDRENNQNKQQHNEYVSQLDYDISVFNFLRYVFSDKTNANEGNSIIILKLKSFLKQSEQYYIYYQLIVETIRFLICSRQEIILNDKLFKQLSIQQQAEIKDFISYLGQQNTNVEDVIIQEYTKSQESYGYQERKLFLKLIEQIRVANIRKK